MVGHGLRLNLMVGGPDQASCQELGQVLAVHVPTLKKARCALTRNLAVCLKW